MLPGLFFDMGSSSKTALIMPAAGTGTRLGLGRPKALVEVAGRPLVRAALEAFLVVEGIVEAVVAAPAGAVGEVTQALSGLEWPACEVRVIAGGATRQESVRCALDALAGHPDLICVHDAARPLVSPRSIEAVLLAAERNGAATAARRVPDSLREELDDGTTQPLDRARVWIVETPQAFSFDVLKRAHQLARATGVRASDDAGLVQACVRHEVVLVETEEANVKVTTTADLHVVRAMLEQRRSMRR